MNGRCNTISLNEAALMAVFQGTAKDALELEGERLLRHMRREVMCTTHGGTPGKPEWRQEVARNLNHTATAMSSDGVSMDFGYSPSDKADEVRAMVVEAGSGSAAGGEPIHAGPTGRSVWNGELSGRHPSRVKSEYPLPAEFNQEGNEFVENAMRMMQTEFGTITEAAFASIPDSTYFGNVTVNSP